MRVAGLTMTANVQQYEYVTQAGDTAGIVVDIVPQYQMPFPEDNGIVISPGHATSIGIKQVLETKSCFSTSHIILKKMERKDKITDRQTDRQTDRPII